RLIAVYQSELRAKIAISVSTSTLLPSLRSPSDVSVTTDAVGAPAFGRGSVRCAGCVAASVGAGPAELDSVVSAAASSFSNVTRPRLKPGVLTLARLFAVT